MKRQPLVKRHVRGFIRSTSDLAEQEKAGTAAGVAEWYRDGLRDLFLKQVAPGEIAWVWRLSMLAEPRDAEDGTRRTHDWGWVCHELGRIVQREAMVVEGATRINSLQESRWPAAIREATRQVLAKRSLSKEEASRRGKAGAKKRHARSSIRIYRAMPADLKELVRALWRSTEYANYNDRAAAINALARSRGQPPLGSGVTVYRMFRKLNGN